MDRSSCNSKNINSMNDMMDCIILFKISKQLDIDWSQDELVWNDLLRLSDCLDLAWLDKEKYTAIENRRIYSNRKQKINIIHNIAR